MTVEKPGESRAFSAVYGTKYELMAITVGSGIIYRQLCPVFTVSYGMRYTRYTALFWVMNQVMLIFDAMNLKKFENGAEGIRAIASFLI